MSPVNKEFKNNVITIFGDAGKQWLTNLPSYLKQLEKEIKIKILTELAPLNVNYVVNAIDNNHNHYVLKCAPPNVEFAQEISALKAFNSQGFVKLIKEDAEQG